MKEYDIKELLDSIQLEREEYLENERQHHANRDKELMKVKHGDYYPLTEHWGYNAYRYSIKTIVMLGLNGSLYGRRDGEGNLVNIPNLDFLEHNPFEYVLGLNIIKFHNDHSFYTDVSLKTDDMK